MTSMDETIYVPNVELIPEAVMTLVRKVSQGPWPEGAEQVPDWACPVFFRGRPRRRLRPVSRPPGTPRSMRRFVVLFEGEGVPVRGSEGISLRAVRRRPGLQQVACSHGSFGKAHDCVAAEQLL